MAIFSPQKESGWGAPRKAASLSVPWAELGYSVPTTPRGCHFAEPAKLPGILPGKHHNSDLCSAERGNTCPQLSWRALWDGRHMHHVGTAGVIQLGCDPRSIFQMLVFQILNNLVTFHSTLRESITHLPRTSGNNAASRNSSLPQDRSAQLVTQPHKAEGNQHFTRWTRAGVCVQVPAGSEEIKGWFSARSDPVCFCRPEVCLTLPVNALTQTGL